MSAATPKCSQCTTNDFTVTVQSKHFCDDCYKQNARAQVKSKVDSLTDKDLKKAKQVLPETSTNAENKKG